MLSDAICPKASVLPIGSDCINMRLRVKVQCEGPLADSEGRKSTCPQTDRQRGGVDGEELKYPLRPLVTRPRYNGTVKT